MSEDFIVKYDNKEIIKQLEKLQSEISDIKIMVAQSVAQARATNGKVKMHTKMIYASFGFTFACLLALIGSGLL